MKRRHFLKGIAVPLKREYSLIFVTNALLKYK